MWCLNRIYQLNKNRCRCKSDVTIEYLTHAIFENQLIALHVVLSTDMCSFCWQKCGPRLKLFLRLKIQHLGVYTYWFSHMCLILLLAYKRNWFSHMCLILLLAYKRNQRIVIRKSEALPWWLAICLLFLWFYLPSVWWLVIGLHEEPANFWREKRSVAFVTSHFFTFLVALSPICLVTTQWLICENQTI